MPEEIYYQELLKSIQELNSLFKIANGEAIRARFREILNEENKKLAYEATDGKKTTREIGTAIGVSHMTIANWWRDWLEQGIVQQGTIRKDRPIKLISLKQIGL